MNMIRVTRKFTFEMAHMLPFHEGLCRNIHGHSYELFVTVKGPVKISPHRPDDGMVIDFSTIKNIVNEAVIYDYDHALVLNRSGEQLVSTDTKTIMMNVSPTCEMLLLEFVKRIKEKMPEEVQLVSVRLSETRSSMAEWLEGDNV